MAAVNLSKLCSVLSAPVSLVSMVSNQLSLVSWFCLVCLYMYTPCSVQSLISYVTPEFTIKDFIFLHILRCAFSTA